jgi:hypothetical protein
MEARGVYYSIKNGDLIGVEKCYGITQRNMKSLPENLRFFLACIKPEVARYIASMVLINIFKKCYK